MAQRTALYDWHLAQGARMVEFTGWSLPVNYPAGILAEHLACRRQAALFDVSHMGRFLVRGPGALAFLRRALTNDAALLASGQSHYSALCDEQGRPLDDVYLFALRPEEYLLVVNAANRARDWQWLTGLNQGGWAELKDLSGDVAMLALQGPASQDILAALLGGALPPPGQGRHAFAAWRRQSMLVSRTGYTGEPFSFELFPPRELAQDLCQALLSAGRAQGLLPAGLGARDTLRLEVGLPLYGHELKPDQPLLTLPLARRALHLGLERGDFLGREALAAQAAELAEGRVELVPTRIYAVAARGRAMIREGSPVLAAGRPVGVLTSGTTVPAWRFAGDEPGGESYTRALGLACLERGLTVGQEVQIIYRERPVPGLVVNSFVQRVGRYLRAISYE